MDVTLSCGAATDTGRRAANEDSYLAQAPAFLVADGMGGHQHGRQASDTAVAALRGLLSHHPLAPEDVVAAVDNARAAVAELAAHPHLAGRAPGSTLSGAVLTRHHGEPYWLVVNIGDSRTYRFRDGQLAQVSVDHSEVQELLDAGQTQIPAELGNIITRALGAGTDSQPDYWLIPVADHDRVLVCSDGLSREVDGPGIARILADEPDPAAAAAHLVAAALAAGGHDNITVVVVDATFTEAQRRDGVATDTVPHRTAVDIDESTLPKRLRAASEEQA